MSCARFSKTSLKGIFEARVDQFVKLAKEDPDWTRDLLLNLSMKLKERTVLSKEDSDYLNPSSIDNYFKPNQETL